MKSTNKRTDTKRLVILDSHAILHRAYHAVPDFSTSKGEPTGALYGLVSMLLKIIDDLKPDYVVACRDLPGKTMRHEVFEDYKGTRAKAEPELIAQLQKAPEIFTAFGIPVYSAPGFEADDCIGTIVHALKDRADIESVIATGDLDALQLVSDRARVYTLRKGLADTILYDADRVRERYGFGPEHVVDYKALRGDPSDNIPGIKGVGEKTAEELIGIFGSIEDMYRAINADPKALEESGVKGKMADKIREGEEAAKLSKHLATIRTDAPISFSLPDHSWRMSEHVDTIIALCEELEFGSLKSRVFAAVERSSGVPQEPQSVMREEIDAREQKETAIALWLLHSDTTSPVLDDILRDGHANDFATARKNLFAELHKTGRLAAVYEDIEKPLISVVERMNATGVAIDTAYLATLAKEYGKELGNAVGKIVAHAGHDFNINSPKQLGVVLYDELKIVPEKQKKTATGARTTREEELAKISDQHPIIADVLAYRELQKLLSTYIEKIPGLVASDGRLHAEFLQAGTTTGRMASQNPNLQNIPVKTEHGKKIRRAFVAPEGKLFAAIDYSQIELRIAAGLSGDETLIHTFKEGGDVHTAVASGVFGVPHEKVDYEMRRRAKVINFGILYGMGVNALRANLGAEVTRAEAADFLAQYFERFSGVKKYIEKTKQDAARLGYTETLFGRRRYFPALTSALPTMRAQAERMATNAPIQGTQADIIKLAMVATDALIEKNDWRDKAKLLLQVHDELVYEVAENEAEPIARELRGIMESVVAPALLGGVPIVAEIAVGKNWGEMTRF